MSHNALSTYVQSNSTSYMGQTNMTSYVGHSTSLPCWALSHTPVTAVEWRRSQMPNYVFLSRDGHDDSGKQDPSYRNRVSLVDSEVRNGDASLVLRDISPGDSGMYECRVKGTESRRRRWAVLGGPPVSTVNLQVHLEQEMTGNRGDDLILHCRAPRDAAVDAVEWLRTDLEPGTYIFLMRDGFPDPTNQHEDYKNRVEMMDPDLKDGNLSLVLRNVSSKDVGTYVCRMKASREREIRATIESKPISIIHLRVETPVISITVYAGNSATFPCRAPVGADVLALEWTRPDLEDDGYVCLVRDGIPDPTRQHPSYRGRVALVDPHLKDGVLSLVLENATRSDTGTYECRLIRGEGRQKRAIIQTEQIRTIKLLVLESGGEVEKDEEKNRTLSTAVVPTEPRAHEHHGLYAVGAAGALVVFMYVILLIM